MDAETKEMFNKVLAELGRLNMKVDNLQQDLQEYQQIICKTLDERQGDIEEIQNDIQCLTIKKILDDRDKLRNKILSKSLIKKDSL